MGSLGNPKPWVPYVNTNDCSQGFCSLYCPQWCYIIFPPPPPLELSAGTSGPNFSPLVIAIIGILASAFLLVSYYAIISKYCGRTDSSRRRDQNREPNEELEDNNEDPSTNHEPWIVPTTGLDEALIKSITVCKYKKGDGLVEGTDCSVCLSEFQDDERLRLLPKCSHAFHVTCIDTWLKSHSNCPLCRANIAFVNASPVIEAPPDIESSAEIHENPVEVDIEMGLGQEEQILQSDECPKTEFIGLSVSGHLEARDSIIEIREEEEEDRQIRRSVSMDYSCQGRVFSIADAMRLKQDEVFQAEECQGDVGSSKQPASEMMSKCSHRSRVLHCVMSPVVMKRSLSSGRFSFSKRGRERSIMIPL